MPEGNTNHLIDGHILTYLCRDFIGLTMILLQILLDS